MILHRQYSADGTHWATIRRLESGNLCAAVFDNTSEPTPFKIVPPEAFGEMLAWVAQWCRG